MSQALLLDMRTDTDSLGSRSDNPESARNSQVFIEASSEDPVLIDDFAFSKQQNFFTMPPDFKLPLNVSKLSEGLPPFHPDNSVITPSYDEEPESNAFPPNAVGDLEPKSLSLIEEVTEYSSSSTIKSADLRTRSKSRTPRTASSHVPRILKAMSPRDSPRDAMKLVKPRLCVNSTLPSKSQPSTPREEEAEADREQKLGAGRGRFTQAKTKLVGRRFLRCSPPREVQGGAHLDPRPMADQPVQTRTGLTLTRPKKESSSPPMSRSASSASLFLNSSPGGLDRSLSRSSGSLVTSHKRPNYRHVESKVRQYIKDVKSLPKKEFSKSCGNLSPVKAASTVEDTSSSSAARPRTAEAAPRLRSYLSSQHLEKIPRFGHIRNQLKPGKKSKSETNLLLAVDFVQSPLQISKSSISLAFDNFEKMQESSGEESARTTLARQEPVGEEVTVFPEDLLALVFQERQGKHETKKVN